MASNPGRTYCCWVENIPGKIKKDSIEQYFKKKAEKYDSFHSIKVEFNEAHKSYQCFLNFLNDNSMVQCVKYLDGKNYCDKILKASERRNKPRPFSVPRPQPPVKNYTETITISNSKYLKAQVEKKIELLNQIFSETHV